MGDDERGPVAKQVLQRQLDQHLRFGVEGRSRFVQDEDRWVAQQDEVRRELAFEAGLRRLLYQGYQSQDSANLGTVLDRLRELDRECGKLIDYGEAVGADTRLNAKLFEMIYEIEDGQRELGFQNYDELEAYVAEGGKTLP